MIEAALKVWITGPSNPAQESTMKMMLADCRVKVTVDVLRGKWKPIIIKALKKSSLGYAELRGIVPEPSKKVLNANRSKTDDPLA